MKHLLITLLLSLIALQPISAQQEGKWDMYLAYHNNTACTIGQHVVYGIFNNNLLRYSPDTKEVKLFSKIDGLSDKNIVYIDYSKQYACLFILYDNGNIDLLFDDGHVKNLPQYALTGDRNLKWKDIDINEQWVVLTNTNGILIVDLKKEEIRSYYNLQCELSTTTVAADTLYTQFGANCYQCPIYGNPLDKKSWQWIDQVSAYKVRVFAGHLWCFTGNGAWTYTIGKSKRPTADPIGKATLLAPKHVIISDKRMLLCCDNEIGIVDIQHPLKVITTIERPKDVLYITDNGTKNLWMSRGKKGLQKYSLCKSAKQKTELKAEGAPINNYGPLADMCYSMHYNKKGTRLLIAGGYMDYSGIRHEPIGMTLEGDKWDFLETDAASNTTGKPFFNVTDIAEDPRNEEIIFLSANTGLYKFKNNKFVHHYDNLNSPLVSAVPISDPHNGEYIRIDGLTYDQQDNLWMVDNETDTIFRILSPKGKWYKYYIEDVKKAPTMEKALIDRNGRLWATSRRSVSHHHSGVLCLDFNNTLTRTTDDKHKYRSAAFNEDGKKVDIGGEYGEVYALHEDQKGMIWIGTTNGVYVVEQPSMWFNQNFRILQPKVPRNDGTNFADYLLADAAVSAITSDGGDRKWIGTYGSGVYLVSPDGTKIIEHFSTNNSPIISNNIFSIAVNPKTGEVMIGTDLGLCSFLSNVTEPIETLGKEELYIYPNPVEPNFRGNVTIRGLSDNAQIRITTTDGRVVAGGRSVGGSYLWNVCATNGKRVGTGVYYIFVSDEKGKKSTEGKIVVI